jgi:hypothetical protein
MRGEVMLTSVRRYSGIGMLACLIAAAGCEKAPPRPAADAAAGAAPGQASLAGEWRWVASKRDGQVVRPTAPADSMIFRVGRYGAYREETGGSTLESRYSLAQGRLHQLQDTAFTVLLLDSSRFFPRSQRQHPAVAVRSLSGDTLILSGTGTDATLHTFVRVGRGE